MNAILNLSQKKPNNEGYYLAFVMRQLNNRFTTSVEHVKYTTSEGFLVNEYSSYGRYFEDDYGLILIWSEEFYTSSEPENYIFNEIEPEFFNDYKFIEKIWEENK